MSSWKYYCAAKSSFGCKIRHTLRVQLNCSEICGLMKSWDQWKLQSQFEKISGWCKKHNTYTEMTIGSISDSIMSEKSFIGIRKHSFKELPGSGTNPSTWKKYLHIVLLTEFEKQQYFSIITFHCCKVDHAYRWFLCTIFSWEKGKAIY